MLARNARPYYGKNGVYIIRNAGDPVENRVKIGMGENITHRINSYYTYFPDGVEILWMCTFKGVLSRSTLGDYERRLAKFIVEAAHGEVEFYFPAGRQRGVEWISVDPNHMTTGMSQFLAWLIDRNALDKAMHENMLKQAYAASLENRPPEKVMQPKKLKMWSKDQRRDDMKIIKKAVREGAVDDAPVGPLYRWPDINADNMTRKKVRREPPEREDDVYIPWSVSQIAQYRKDPRRSARIKKLKRVSYED